MRPSRVTTGRSLIPWVAVTIFSGPVSDRSMRRLPMVISAMRMPSLKASMVWARSRAESPASARRNWSGMTLISGAPISRPGRGRVRCPSLRGSTSRMISSARRATSILTSRSGPEISKRIDRDPPMPREKSEDWRTEARVPGSLRTGFSIKSSNSPARAGSTALAPTKARSARATKKKCLILGGSPGLDSGPDTLAQ